MKKIFIILFAFMAMSVSAQSYYSGQWYSLLSNQEYSISVSGLWGDETQEQEFTVFSPSESTMTFQCKNRKYFVGNNYGSLDLDFYESTNGSSYGEATRVVEYGVRTDKTSFQNESYSVQNPNTLRKFKFSMHTTYGCTVANLRLPMKHHILFENGTVNGKATWEDKAFGELAIDEVSEPYMVNFRSFYTNGDLTITSSIPEVFRVGSADNTAALVYAVGANACATKTGNGEAGGSKLGNVANYNFGVYFCPQAEQEYEGTITISDGTNTCTFNVTGTGLKVDQSINWEPAEKYAWEDAIVLASATSGLDVTYEISNPDVLKFENGSFVKLYVGEVSVTAKQAGNYKFNAAADVVRTFTIAGQVTSAEENMTITYGDEKEWNGIALKDSTVGVHYVVFETTNATGGLHTITLTLTVNKMETLNVPVDLQFCAGGSDFYRGVEYSEAGTYPVNATGATRDTVYNVTVTVLQPTTGTDTKTIVYGAEEEWNGISLKDSTVGVHTVIFVTSNAAGCDSTVTLTLTVNKQAAVEMEYPIEFCAEDQQTYRGVVYTETGSFPLDLIEGTIRDTMITVVVTVHEKILTTEYKEDSVGHVIELPEGEWYLGEELIEGSTYELQLEDTTGLEFIHYDETKFGCDSTVKIIVTVLYQAEPENPGETTALERVNANSEAVKEFRNGTLYIRRGERLFTAEGREVK